jgi:transcriptional regulator GlxA family with amidase domain
LNAWRRVVDLILTYESMGIALPPSAARNLDEFTISLVLELHPHTYSDALRKPFSTAAPRVVREAQHLLRTSGPQISVSDVAKTLGVSMRSLEKGFRDSYQAAPTRYLRRLRRNRRKLR